MISKKESKKVGTERSDENLVSVNMRKDNISQNRLVKNVSCFLEVRVRTEKSPFG